METFDCSQCKKTKPLKDRFKKADKIQDKKIQSSIGLWCRACRKKFTDKKYYEKKKKNKFECKNCKKKLDLSLKAFGRKLCINCKKIDDRNRKKKFLNKQNKIVILGPNECKYCKAKDLKKEDFYRKNFCKNCRNFRRRQIRIKKRKYDYNYKIEDDNFILDKQAIKGQFKEYSTTDPTLINEIVYMKKFDSIINFLNKAANWHEFKINFKATAEIDKDGVVVNTTVVQSNPFHLYYKQRRANIIGNN